MNTINFIWLGNVKKPLDIINSWNEDDLKIKIWSEDNLNEIENFHNIDKFYESNKPNQKSDILRLEILYQYGGIYMDSDIICLKKLSKLIKKLNNIDKDFFICREKKNCISNSFFYIKNKKNKLIKKMINELSLCEIKNDKNEYNPIHKTTGPKFITEILKESDEDDYHILDYYYFNFCLDFSKLFINDEFKILENMKLQSKNKDLQYEVDLDNIFGIQLWLGGKSVTYNSLSKKNIDNAYKNFQIYLKFFKEFSLKN